MSLGVIFYGTCHFCRKLNLIQRNKCLNVDRSLDIKCGEVPSVIIYYNQKCLTSMKIEIAGKWNSAYQDMSTEVVNEYDQEIPQSQTADNPVAP